nr:hypothetical protein [Tanacetum cinerariifolium]
DSQTHSCSQSANECCDYRHDGYSQTISATLPPAPVKAVKETCITCGGAHPYYQCLAAGGNTFPEFRDNIQGYVAAAAVNYNQGNPGYRPSGFNRRNEQPYQAPAPQNQNVHLNELEKVRRMNEANMKAMQTQIDMVKNKLRNEMKSSTQTSLSNQTNEIKNMMASLLQIKTAFNSGSGSLPSNTIANPKGELKAITTRSGLVIDGTTIPTPSRFINPKEDEHVEETFTDPDLAEYTIKVPPPPAQKYKPLSQREFVVHQRDPHYANIPYPSRMLKQKQQEKDEAQIHKFWQMFKQLHNNITLADALILMPKYQKMLKALLSNKEKLQELANTPLNENLLSDDFVIIDYESDPRVPLILGRPFLQTARALIDVHGKEMILCDGDERLTLNMRHDTSSYSNQPQKELINLINVFNNSSDDFLEDLFPYQPSGNPTFSPHPELTSPEVNNDIFDSEGCNVLSKKLLDLDSTKDLNPPLYDNQLSGSTTYPLLEEFADELPLEYDDNLQFDIESDLKEIEILLYQDKDSSLKDSIDQKNCANLADIFVDSIPEMFTDEHTLDYSSPPIFDVYADDFLEVGSDAENIYNDPFDSKGEKIKESKLFIDELDLPCDFHPPPEYDSFISQDFSRVDALPSTNNEDKILNPYLASQAGQSCAKICETTGYDPPQMIVNVGTAG